MKKENIDIPIPLYKTSKLIDVIKQKKQDLNGSYIYLKQIGEGGYGTVHLVYDCFHKRPIAVKHQNHALDELEKEYNLLRLLQPKCPYVSSFCQYISRQHHGYLITEYITNGDLHCSNQFTISTISPIIISLLTALYQVHRHGYIHGDIKPENILLRTPQEPILIDFGLAIRKQSQHRNPLNEICGTLQYMSLLQHDTLHIVSPYDDLWSLGLTCLSLLHSKPLPWERIIDERTNSQWDNDQVDDTELSRLIYQEKKKTFKTYVKEGHPIFHTYFVQLLPWKKHRTIPPVVYRQLQQLFIPFIDVTSASD